MLVSRQVDESEREDVVQIGSSKIERPVHEGIVLNLWLPIGQWEETP